MVWKCNVMALSTQCTRTLSPTTNFVISSLHDNLTINTSLYYNTILLELCRCAVTDAASMPGEPLASVADHMNKFRKGSIRGLLSKSTGSHCAGDCSKSWTSIWQCRLRACNEHQLLTLQPDCFPTVSKCTPDTKAINQNCCDNYEHFTRPQ